MDLTRQPQAFGQRPALVLVDMINGFTDPTSPLGSESGAVVAANKKLLLAFRRQRLPIFYTTTVYHRPEDARVFRDRLPALDILQPGSRWVDVDPELKPLAEEPLIEKKWASGFFATDLAERLNRANVDCVVVTGLTTSGCVRATAVDGLQHDFRVFVPVEAVGDRNTEAHKANLHDLHAKYVDTCAVDDVLGWLDAV